MIDRIKSFPFGYGKLQMNEENTGYFAFHESVKYSTFV